MANGVPANYPLPDPATVIAGEPVSDPPPQTLLNASNWFAAAPAGRIGQCWNYTDDLCRRTNGFPAMPAAGSKGAHVACWPVPAYGVRTDLEVYAFGRRDGATGSVRFRSVATGATVTLVLGAADGWTAIGALTVDCSSGEDEVELYIAGDGVADTHVFVAAGEFPVITGSLATPAAGEPTPFDSAELDPDEPWSSDIDEIFQDNLDLFLGWLSSYFCWSGVQNVTSGAKASYSMPEWDHQVVSSVHRGQLRTELTWEVKAQVANVGGGDEAIIIGLGGVDALTRDAVVVPGPAGAAAVTGELQPADIDANGREVRGFADVEHPLVFLTVIGDRNYTTADLYSLSIRGI